MVPDSRFIPALFGEIKVHAVRKVESPKKQAHDAMGPFERMTPIRYPQGKQAATSQNKNPCKKPHATGHKKSCGMERAPIKNNPAEGQPQQPKHASNILRSRVCVQPNCRSDNEPGDQRWEHGLGDSASWGRPERLG